MALKDNVKRWLGIGVPGGVDDIVVRAVKTGVAVFLAQPFVVLLNQGEFDLNAGKAAVFAAVAATISALLNAALLAIAAWSNSR